MPKRYLFFGGLIGLAWASAAAAAEEPILVTATRAPEPEISTPVADIVITGEEARSRGATDLRSALAPAAGVEVLPGSDTGRGGSVVAMQGLTEMGAYLLVVDGVPYGGAFNPATATLDLIDFDRIEVIRGAAPVTYGATSFVGIIHVIQADAGSQPTRALLQAGTHDSGRAAFATNLSQGAVGESLLGSVERRGYSQDRSNTRRAHLLYRAPTDVGAGRLRLDLDGTILRQAPYSPHPTDEEEGGLSPDFQLDANANRAMRRRPGPDAGDPRLRYQRREGGLVDDPVGLTHLEPQRSRFPPRRLRRDRHRQQCRRLPSAGADQRPLF